MKQHNALWETAAIKHASYLCCLAHVRSLLGSIRKRHRLAKSIDTVGRTDTDRDEDFPAPSLHDFHVGELEASMLGPSPDAGVDDPQSISYNSPQELARAKRVFAATLLVPMLLISALLIATGNALDHPMISLLRFSIVLLAIPLTATGSVWFFQNRARRQS